MPDNSDNAMAPIMAWIMQPNAVPVGDGTTADQFDWNWSRWQLLGRVIAGRCRAAASSMGDATFRVLRRTRTDPDQPRPRTDTVDSLYVGSYVAITAGEYGDAMGATGLNLSSILWWGWLASYTGSQIKGTDDIIGTAQAYEIGQLLDRMQVVGWARKSPDSAYPDPMEAPPTANIAGIGEQVIGNAYLGTDLNGSPVYLFARTPAECGTDQATQGAKYWTRWRLARHLVKVCRPAGLPTFKIIPQGQTVEPADDVATDTLAGYLNATGLGKAEVFDLVDPTYRGQLDLMFPRTLGIGWRADIGRDAWTFVPYSLAESNDFGIPANAAKQTVSASVDDLITDITVRRSADDLPDEIVMEGGRCVWTGTISFGDTTAAIGWSEGAMLSDYKAGASTAAGYSGLSTTNKKIRNRAVRNGPAIHDVFTRYIPAPTGNGDLQVSTPPGTGSGTALRPLVPSISVDTDGTTVRVNEISRCPYLPSASLLRTLPWPEGLKTDGDDKRTAESKAQPQYLLPRVFRYLVSDTNQWRDLTADNGSADFYPVQVDVDANGCAIRIQTVPPEGLAKGHWSGAVIADIDPDSDTKAIDYLNLVFTIAIESDQRVRYAIRRPGVTTVRRPLVIRDQRFQCWGVRKGTILGLKDDGTPDRVSVTNEPNGIAYLTRNDWPALVKRAKQVAAFTFRSRTAVGIERARPDLTPVWGVVGTMIETANEVDPADGLPGTSTTCNTVVEEVVRDFGNAPRLTISTSLPDSPFPAGGGGAGADRGGSVSVSNTGTVAQQAQRISGRLDDLARDVSRPPLIPSKGGASAAAAWTLSIVGGNTLSDGSSLGIKYVAGGVSAVPSAYDPNVTSSFIDGIGRATLYINGTAQPGFVLVVHDNRSGGITDALFAADICLASPTTVNIPITGDPNGATVTCYVVLTP